MIKCPQCGWKPRGQALWKCDDCQTPFNTFDNHGVCPACSCVHEVTLCPQCRVFSMHEHWYHVDDDEPTMWQRVLGVGKSKKKKKSE